MSTFGRRTPTGHARFLLNEIGGQFYILIFVYENLWAAVAPPLILPPPFVINNLSRPRPKTKNKIVQTWVEIWYGDII